MRKYANVTAKPWSDSLISWRQSKTCATSSCYYLYMHVYGWLTKSRVCSSAKCSQPVNHVSRLAFIATRLVQERVRQTSSHVPPLLRWRDGVCLFTSKVRVVGKPGNSIDTL